MITGDLQIPIVNSIQKADKGFTLLEVIVVLTLLGLLAVAALSRVSGDLGKLHKATDTLKSHLRFAQTMAMNSERSWGVSSTGSSYWLFSGGDIHSRSPFPGEDDSVVHLPDSISTDSFTICFDRDWGAPYNSAAPDNETKLSQDTGNMEIDVSSDSASNRIIITPNTGFIP